jgi:glycosyltransferase involved in cell wall biosynthesis
MQVTGTTTPRPRVLLLIKGLGLGGAERLLVDVVTHRGRQGFDYEVAYVLSGQDALVPAMHEAGVPTHDLGASGSTDLGWMLRLRRLLAAGRFDVLHSHLPYSAAMGRLVALSVPRRRRPVLVYTEHSLWNKAAIVTKALNGSTVGLDSALFVVSTAARDALPPRLRGRAQVVVHGVDRARFAVEDRDPSPRHAVRAELGVPDDEILALTVANVRAEKGYDVLLEAARLTGVEGVAVRFVSVGRGELEGPLRSAADGPGLRGRFEHLGTRTDIVRLMAGADVFVLPSHQEGLPVALMEAMSAGLPVVVTAVGGVPDIVSDGVEGLVVAPGRPDLLAAAVARLASDPRLRARLGEAAQLRSQDFDVSRAVEAIEAAYTRILKER